MTRLLRGRAVGHQRGAEHRDAAAIDGLGRLGPRHLFVEDDLLHDRDAAAAVLGGPVEADVARLVQRALPLAQPVDFVAVGARGGEGPALEVGRHVLGEPGAGLGPEALLLWREVEVHYSPLTNSALASPQRLSSNCDPLP